MQTNFSIHKKIFHYILTVMIQQDVLSDLAAFQCLFSVLQWEIYGGKCVAKKKKKKDFKELLGNYNSYNSNQV